MSQYRQGNFGGAAQTMANTQPRGQDRLLWHLETAKAHQDAGKLNQSVNTFRQADKLVERFYGTAKVRLLEETAVIAVDQTVREYRGSPADRILLSTYQSLNHLLLGDLELARVHTRRAADRQAEAEQAYSGAIQRARRQARSEGLNPDRTLASADVESRFAEVGRYASPEYADYTNPLATYLGGLAALIDGDAALGQNLMAEARDQVPNNRYVRAELGRESLPRVADRGQPMVYVIFETGLAPRRKPIRIPIVTPQAGYSVIALPTLDIQDPSVTALRVDTSAGQAGRTQRIASINGIVATQFRHELPLIILSTALSVAAKEAATQALREEYGDAGLLIGSLYKAATSSVDLRTWRTPGAEVQIMRLPRPEDGVLSLRPITGASAAASGTGHRVALANAPLNLVYVRSVQPGAMHVIQRAYQQPPVYRGRTLSQRQTAEPAG